MGHNYSQPQPASSFDDVDDEAAAKFTGTEENMRFEMQIGLLELSQQNCTDLSVVVSSLKEDNERLKNDNVILREDGASHQSATGSVLHNLGQLELLLVELEASRSSKEEIKAKYEAKLVQVREKKESIVECSEAAQSALQRKSMQEIKEKKERGVRQMVANNNEMQMQLELQKNQTLEMVAKHAIELRRMNDLLIKNKQDFNQELNQSRAELENHQIFMIDLGIGKTNWMELEPAELANEYKRDQQQEKDDLLRNGLIAGAGGFAVIMLYLFLAFYLLRKCCKKSARRNLNKRTKSMCHCR